MKEINLRDIKINAILIGLITGIMWRYPITDKVYYVYLVGIFCFLLLKVLINSGLKIHLKNLLFIGIAVISLTYMVLLSIDNISFIVKRYLLLYLLLVYLYLSFLRYGLNYAESFYKQLMIMLNVLSVLNLYQVVFRKPLLLNFMELAEVGYNYNFGTSAYRTMSVFHHPIIAGLFFLIALLCNMYILKPSVIKYILQALLLLNIYSTSSRSAWLAVVVVFSFYIIIHHRKLLTKILRPKLTYLNMAMSCVLIAVGSVFLILFFQDVYQAIIDRFGDSLSKNSTSGSNLQRTMTISLIWNHMFDNGGFRLFFGYGAGTVSKFMLENPLLIQNFGTTDNQYLTWFYEFGLIGILFYISLLMFICVKYFKNKKKHWTIELSFLLFLVLSFELIFFDALGWPVVLIMLTFLIAVLTYKFKPEESQSTKTLN